MNKISIETSKDNYKILKINKDGKEIYLGSKYNQKREIDKFINSFDSFTENDIYIILGASCLEHVIELRKKNRNLRKILILEVNDEIKEFLENDKKLKDIIFDKKIMIASNIMQVRKFFEKYINDMNINFVKIGYYLNYDKIYASELNEMMNFIKNQSYSVISNKNTNLYFGETWFNTLMENLRYMKNSIPVNDMKNKFRNKPAIIVSAGPSLSKNIEKLKGIDNALILSGGRTLNTLLEKGIKVDYLGVIDPGEISYKLVEKNIESINIPLIYYNGTNSKIVKEHKAKKIFYADNDFIKDLFEENIVSPIGGGSIVHFLVDFAIYTGCNPIVFIGQDLAYTNEKLHDDIATHQYKTDNTAWECKTDLYVDDINGRKVRTSVILNGFRLSLEKIIKLNPKIKFINATEGGANINGTEIRDLEGILNEFNEFEKNVEINERFIDVKEFNNKIESYIKMMNEIQQQTRSGIKIVDNLSEALERSDNEKINKNIRKLDKIDKLIGKDLSKLSIFQNKIFASMYEINNSLDFVICNDDNEEVKRLKNLAKNKALYSELNIHSKQIKEKLEELLKNS